MKSIINTLKNKDAVVSLKGASPEDIKNAETTLGLTFADDYKEYVSVYGAVSYYEHELTGVCKAKSLDVVRITLLEKEVNEVPVDWYVIEQAHVDGVVFWQDSTGKIYRTQIKKQPKKVYSSLLEYINQ